MVLLVFFLLVNICDHRKSHSSAILGDEVVIIQDKLEGIKARYKDITKLCSDVSKTLEHALQLAGQLHSTHEQLCKWLDEVEVELLSYETQLPTGEELSQVQERQKVGFRTCELLLYDSCRVCVNFCLAWRCFVDN